MTAFFRGGPSFNQLLVLNYLDVIIITFSHYILIELNVVWNADFQYHGSYFMHRLVLSRDFSV